MEITETTYAASREEWRAWLEQNHDKAPEIWLVYYKKNSGKPSVSYDEAVEEALCFGWIDGITKTLDADRYAQRFTPRRPKSNWSEPNKRRVEKMIREGRMTPAGLAKITYDLDAPLAPAKPKGAPAPDLPVPDYLRQALTANPIAWENFTNLAPSHRRDYIRWIEAAKREETRKKRIAEALELLAEGRPLGMK